MKSKTTGYEKNEKPKTSGYENENQWLRNQKPNDNENDTVNDTGNEKEKQKQKQNDNRKKSTTATADPFQNYLNNINPTPTPIEAELLESYISDTPAELINFAIEKAVENKARSMRIHKSDPKRMGEKRNSNTCRSQRRSKRKRRS